MNHLIKRLSSFALVALFVVFLIPAPQAGATDIADIDFSVEDLGNGFSAETQLIIYSPVTRNTSKSAQVIRTIKKDGSTIATVTFNVTFTNNGITAGVVSTSYSKSVVSGWSYVNHSITKTDVASSSGGTATLRAELKKFPFTVPVNITVHCSPSGVITKS